MLNCKKLYNPLFLFSFVERTLVIIKSDGIQKGLVGEILKRIESRGLKIYKIKQMRLNEDICFNIYGDSLKKFPQIRESLIDYMTNKDVIVLIITGENAISEVRKIRGLSNPAKSPLGSVRRDFAGDQNMEELTLKGITTKNVMHSSGDKEEANFEIKLFFNEDEI